MNHDWDYEETGPGYYHIWSDTDTDYGVFDQSVLIQAKHSERNTEIIRKIIKLLEEIE